VKSVEERIADALLDERIACPKSGRKLSDFIEVCSSVCRIIHVYVWQGDHYAFDHTAEHEVCDYDFETYQCPICGAKLKEAGGKIR